MASRRLESCNQLSQVPLLLLKIGGKYFLTNVARRNDKSGFSHGIIGDSVIHQSFRLDILFALSNFRFG